MCARQATILEEGEFQPANGHEKKKKKMLGHKFSNL